MYSTESVATEKALVSAFALTLGTGSQFDLDDRCSLGGVSIESKYEGYLDERVW